jgi:hypothetical protein
MGTGNGGESVDNVNRWQVVYAGKKCSEMVRNGMYIV